MEIEKYKYKTLLFSFDSMIRLSCHNFLFCCKSLKKLCETFPTKTFAIRALRPYRANMRKRANTPQPKQAHKKASLSTCLFSFS